MQLTPIRQTSALALLVLFMALPNPASAQNDAALWDTIRTGSAFAIMRHALAPGTGDPQSVVIGDCTTQRNLSENGRAQARKIGSGFRTNGITAARVLTSAWCRCAETAKLLSLGKVERLAPLNSFFVTRSREPAQTAALKAWILQDKPARTSRRPLVLVTHQVNITALTGVYPRSGEIVVARYAEDGKVAVLGTLFPAEAR
ncbi:MAG: phosphohistidine phosphatase SixA [Paracoccaceae bacterium]|jgi:phosphohistidine phosphatase SixA